MAENEEVIEDDAEFEKELDKAGTKRGALRRALEKSDPKMAELFSDMTPEQRAWGKLIGQLLLQKSNDGVEQVFDWWAHEYNEGIALKNAEKATAFFHAIGSLGIDDAHYRILRRMYVKANVNE